ncbi:MAG: LTA synthase family protein [Micavibrio sp.]|nr:LTA synthase family protein [Micavibrio sp.]
MTPTLKYYWQRVKPFFLFFIACETLIRAVLMVHEWKDLQDVGAGAIGAFVVGYLFDVTVFCYFTLPFLAYMLLLPARLHGSRKDKVATAVVFFLMAFVMLFSATGEWFFWDEFQSRYNFIAVDYLVYTREVVGNIRESYPVGPLMSAMAVVAGFFAFRVFSGNFPAAAPDRRQRLGTLAGMTALCVALFFGVSSSYGNISANRYLDEIARNGIYELFSAFNNNALSYDKFYTKLPDDKAAALLRQELGIDGEKGESPLDHKVVSKAPEHKYNLVLITVESFSGDYLKIFGNQDGLTPHLDKLVDQSMFFTHLYATGTRTVYGLSAITLAMPPVPGNAIVRQPENGNLASLGGVLKSKGYDTKFIYGGYGYFDNMNAFFAANGYDIVDRNSLSNDEITFANVWGVADEDLYRRVMKENDDAHKAGKPFFDMVMTTSNHRPFTYPDGRIDIPSHTGRSGGVKYTDYTIDQFLNEAKKHPWFDNTIFVIVADHTAGSAGKSELDPLKYHIPMFIYAPGIVKPGKVDKMASQVDIAPTLLSLMGVSYQSRFYGKDLMTESPNRAFISNYQKLGYMTKDGLIILKPVDVSEFYTRKDDDFALAGKPPQDMLDKAIAYYQGAAKWKTWSRQP